MMGRSKLSGGNLVRRGRIPRASRESLVGRLWALRLAVLAVLIGACGDGGGPGDLPRTAAVSAALTVTSPELLTINYPAAVDIRTVPVLAKGTLRLNDRVSVVGSPTTVVNIGTGETNIGADARVGNVQSLGRVVLRDRARASGAVVSASTVQLQNGASAAGGVTQNASIPLQAMELALPQRSASQGPINLEPDRSLTLEPGTYDDVSIKSRSTLRLRKGVYLFNAFTLEPQAKLELDDAEGTVQVYMSGTFTFRGAVTAQSGLFPKLFLVTTSSNQVTVDAPFRGTIIAPNAKIALISTSAGHEGAFFGKDVEAQPATPIRLNPPNWDEITGPVEVTLRWPEGTLLRAADPAGPDGATDGHVTLPEGIDFRIPERLRVAEGNAGNHDGVFRYRDPDGDIVTCTYRGGASTAEPTTPLDVARGLTYVFVGCSNGAEAGSTASGNEFWLDIAGVAEPLNGYTMVDMYLDGCGGKLDPAFWPDESAQMAQDFSWAVTSPVPETDAQGRPTLYYANIYIEDAEQLGALNDAYIHYAQEPIFTTELERFFGQCGSVDSGSDGEGVFVFAVLPGQTYNLLREYALTPDPTTGEDRTIFDVVILRTPPEGAGNADGSLSWQALMDAGFLYRGETEFTEPDQQQPRRRGWFRRLCRDVARRVGEVVQSSVRVVESALGAAHLLIARDRHLDFTLTVDNKDPLFEGEMKQAWGGAAGDPTRPDRVKVDVRMWLQLLPVPVVAPTLFYGVTDNLGQTRVTVPRKAMTRYQNPVCITLDNHAATVTDYLLPVRVCDYGGGNNDGIPTDVAHADVSLASDQHKIHMHTAVTDAYSYFRDVAEYEPHRVVVLTDWLANHFTGKWDFFEDKPSISPEDHPAFAGCLGLNEQDDVWPVVIQALPYDHPFLHTAVALALGAAITAVSQADIVMPDMQQKYKDSRGIIVHEYGHFALCSLMYDSRSTDLPKFIRKRMSTPRKIGPTDEAAILSDAFADFVAEQVVAGVDYVAPSSIKFDAWESMHYCRNVPGVELGPCLEGNANGTPLSGVFAEMKESKGATAEGKLELARVLTTWHDAFDGHYIPGQLRRGFNSPGNGDYYTESTSGHLEITPEGWVSLDPTRHHDDENVSLPGRAIYDWGILWREVALVDFTIASAMNQLTKTMVDHGSTWCDACELYTLHEDGFDTDTPFWEQWMACSQGRLAEYVGAPPDAGYNMQAADCSACPVHAHTDPTSGICVACGVGEVAVTGGCFACLDGSMAPADSNTCLDCPAHTVSNADHTDCDACAAGEIAVSNICTQCDPGTEPADGFDLCAPCPEGEVAPEGVCYPCDPGTTPDPWQITCVPCPVDATIPYDQQSFACMDGPHWRLDLDLSPAAGTCGNSHDMLLTGLLAIPMFRDISVQVQGPSTEAACFATTGDLWMRFENQFPAWIPFMPTWSAGNCDLTGPYEIGSFVRQLGLDEAELSVISDADVDLLVTSGGLCPPL
ncbi:MAG: hypothetical protein JW751_12465 [Polyangiaceae bacterium]|nr:hypothetical protein [Polyangiaceae bacterium]